MWPMAIWTKTAACSYYGEVSYNQCITVAHLWGSIQLGGGGYLFEQEMGLIMPKKYLRSDAGGATHTPQTLTSMARGREPLLCFCCCLLLSFFCPNILVVVKCSPPPPPISRFYQPLYSSNYLPPPIQQNHYKCC